MKAEAKEKVKKIKQASRAELPTMRPTKIKHSKKKLNLARELTKEIRFHLELLREEENVN